MELDTETYKLSLCLKLKILLEIRLNGNCNKSLVWCSNIMQKLNLILIFILHNPLNVGVEKIRKEF